MNGYFLLHEAVPFIIIGGSILFGVGYFLPDEIALQVASFIGGLIGYIIYVRISSRDPKDVSHKSILMFTVTLLMSLWATLCLWLACAVFAKLPLCTENRRNAFAILNFFFPMLIVFFGWVSNHWPRSK